MAVFQTFLLDQSFIVSHYLSIDFNQNLFTFSHRFSTDRFIVFYKLESPHSSVLIYHL